MTYYVNQSVETEITITDQQGDEISDATITVNGDNDFSIELDIIIPSASDVALLDVLANYSISTAHDLEKLLSNYYDANTEKYLKLGKAVEEFLG